MRPVLQRTWPSYPTSCAPLGNGMGEIRRSNLLFVPSIVLVQVDQIRLIYSGKQLADDHTLAHYNVAAGGTIHMVLQLRGGSR